eukprot:2071361-Amphidinium_carterae.2
MDARRVQAINALVMHLLKFLQCFPGAHIILDHWIAFVLYIPAARATCSLVTFDTCSYGDAAKIGRQWLTDIPELRSLRPCQGSHIHQLLGVLDLGSHASATQLRFVTSWSMWLSSSPMKEESPLRLVHQSSGRVAHSATTGLAARMYRQRRGRTSQIVVHALPATDSKHCFLHAVLAGSKLLWFRGVDGGYSCKVWVFSIRLMQLRSSGVKGASEAGKEAGSANDMKSGFRLVGMADVLDFCPAESRLPKLSELDMKASSKWSSRAVAASRLASDSESLDAGTSERLARGSPHA